MLVVYAIAILISFPGYAFSACSGSGIAWSCTAGSTVAQVNTVLSSAANNAVVTFDSGSYTWTTGPIQLNNAGTKGVTLICQTIRSCNVTYGGSGVFYRDFMAGTSPDLIRLSGFVFSGNPGTAAVWLYGNNATQKLRIDNNTFQGQSTGTITILLGESSSTGTFAGVIDHNIFTGSTNIMGFKNLSGGTTWQTGRQGSGTETMFFEDNQCTFSSYPDSGTGCVDDWRANSTVLRFNTITNSRFVNHSYCHGGPYNSEVYGNNISNSAFTGAQDYRNIHFQGSGEEIVWGNQVNNTSGNAITIQHFRSDSSTATSEGSCTSIANGTNAIDGNRTPLASYYGYPAWRQPSRDVNGTMRPVYAWRNRTSSGVRVDVIVQSGGWTGNAIDCANTDGGRVNCHLRLNRDIYQASSLTYQTSPTSPFNGTTGVGFGTLANMPTTCTPTSETLDAGQGGVGYWCSNCGSWKTATPSQGVDVDNGVLYRCSATNTWIVHYTPYTYPHPLISGGSSGDTTPPSPPSGIYISQQKEE